MTTIVKQFFLGSMLKRYLSKNREEEITNISEIEVEIPEKQLSLREALKLLVNKADGYWMLFAAGSNGGSREANLFSTPFGRDALIQLKMLKIADSYNKLDIFPLELFDPTIKQIINLSLEELENDVLSYLASKQGLKFNLKSEEEVGKIMHEHRSENDLEYQHLVNRGWEFPYYGSIDATLEYILAIKNKAKIHPNFLEQKYIDRNNQTQTFGDSLNLAKNCLINWINKDPEKGLLYYKKLNQTGVEVQSWRDSEDAISTLIHGIKPDFNKPLAIMELQVLAFEALVEVGELEIANKLQESFFKEFICYLEPDETSGDKPYLAMAIQENVKFDALSSANLAILSHSIFNSYEKLKLQITDATYPELVSQGNFTQNCIVSLSFSSNRYHIAGYHTGNVWLFDNVNCALGLMHTKEPKNLFRAKLILTQVIEICEKTKLYPELVGRDSYTNVTIDVLDLKDSRQNRVAQPGQPLQGWTVSAVILANRLLSELKAKK